MGQFLNDPVPAEGNSKFSDAPQPDAVGRFKEFVTAEPKPGERQGLLGGEYGRGILDLGKPVRAIGRAVLPDTNKDAARDALIMGAAAPLRFLRPAAGFANDVALPAMARTAASTLPDLAAGDTNSAVQRGANTATLEALMALIGVPGRWMASRRAAQNAPAIHQAVTPPEPTPTIYGPRGEVAVAPRQPPITVNASGGPVTVQPPSSGAWSTSNMSPAVIVQEHMPRTVTPRAQIPEAGKVAADIATTQNETPKNATTTGLFGESGLVGYLSGIGRRLAGEGLAH